MQSSKSRRPKSNESESKLTCLWKNIVYLNLKVFLSFNSDCDYVIKLYRTFQDEMNLFIQMECP